MKTLSLIKTNRTVHKKTSFILLLLLVLTCVFNSSLYSKTLDDAVDEAIQQLIDTGLKDKTNEEMVIEVVNIHTQKFDRDARVIQSSLYTVLKSRFPKSRLLLKDESLVGVSSRAILIKGTYQPKEQKTFLVLQAFNFKTGELYAKADVEYDVQRKKYENLVVVLPIEAPTLQKPVAKTFSQIFRSVLTKTGAFNLISSDAIDKINADEIQEQYQCTREECSTIVAESLNATWVITTYYSKITDQIYYLTGSLKDVKTGRTIKEEAVQHNGDISTLNVELEKLACLLAGTCNSLIVQEPIVKSQVIEQDFTKIPAPTRDMPPKQIEDSSWPWWYWAIGAAVIGAIAAASSGSSGDSSSGGGSSSSSCPSGAGTCGSAEYTW